MNGGTARQIVSDQRLAPGRHGYRLSAGTLLSDPAWPRSEGISDLVEAPCRQVRPARVSSNAGRPPGAEVGEAESERAVRRNVRGRCQGAPPDNAPIRMTAPSGHHQSSRSSGLWEIFLAVLQLGVAGFGRLIAHFAYCRSAFTAASPAPSPPAHGPTARARRSPRARACRSR
jgi:hypothetical protein